MRSGILAAALLVGAGCATTPPKELNDARAAYRRAAEGPAKKDAPVELYEASQALERADRAWRRGDGEAAEDLAYVAERRAQIAESRARAEIARRNRERAERAWQTYQAERERKAEIELAEARARLERLEQARSGDEGELERARAELADREEELERERTAREEAEARADEALASLERLGEVREEARGTVLTLSGSLLFASGSADLLPAARERLSEVARALASTPERAIVIEGHTDAQGPEGYNEELSFARAEAVRAFLIDRGIAEDRVRARGFGESRPVASNGSSEGRANNRRVEIVLERLEASGPREPGTGGAGALQGPAGSDPASAPEDPSPTER